MNANSFDRRAGVVLAAAAIGMVGCAERPIQVVASERGPVPAVSAARVSGKVETTDAKAAVTIREDGSPVKGGGPSLPVAPEKGDITLSFVDTDIREIARVVLGNLLKVNYAIDASVQGSATLQTVEPVAPSALLPLLDTALAQVGGTVVQENGVYRIVPLSEGLPPVQGATAGLSSQIITLRYASAQQIAKVLEPYVPDGAKLIADPSRNVLVISGNTATRKSLVDLVRVFDVDFLAGRSYALLPIINGVPGKVAADLQRYLQADGEGPLAGVVRVFAIDQANAVLVVSQQPRYIDLATKFVADLERVRTETERTMHVYYVQNGSAADLEQVLRRAFATGGTGSSEQGPGEVTPGSQGGIEFGGSSSPGGLGTGGGGATGLGGAATGATQTSPGSTGLGAQTGGTGLGGGSQTASGGAQTDALSGGLESGLTGESAGPAGGGAKNALRIVSNKRNNALLIYATEAEYAEIEATLRKIDILPMQVLIEATIAEVDLNDTLQYGVEYYFRNSGVNVRLSNAADANILPGFPGFAVSSGSFALQALQGITNVRVLSSPQLLVLDSERARLQVGSLVPIISQSSQSVLTSGAPLVNTVEYRETGVILTVQPRITSGGLVTLDVEQEVSTPLQTTTSSITSPTFSQRRVRSRIAVQDGETVGLGGLISDTVQNATSGIPILGDIPILGALFSTKTDSRVRTELIVLLTPRVVRDQREARILTEELKRKLSRAAFVGQDQPPLRPPPTPPLAPLLNE